jgi:hypothetical protein
VKEDETGRASSTNGERKNVYRIMVGKPEGKRHNEDQDVGGWTILKWILDRMGWYGLNRLGWDGMD